MKWKVAMLLCLLSLGRLVEAAESVAFFYGAHPPVHLLAHFHHVVVEPDEFSKEQLKRLQRNGRVVHAYVSVGEVGRERPWLKETKEVWQLGKNPDWGSWVMDLSSPGWRNYLFEHRFRPLWKEGYRGFFLDTLDSYLLATRSGEARKRQQAGLTELILRLRREFPQASIFVNRGFEVIEQVAGSIDGVAAESLYRGWDPGSQEYRKVAPKDRRWLRKKLKQIRKRYPHLMVMVLDYLPPGKWEEARRVADRIRQDGFVPWISTPAQNQMGVGSVEVLPREVLMLWDSSQEPEGELAFSDIHRLAAMPLEYLGFVPVYRDIRKGLPEGPLSGRYAGVISWFSRNVSTPDYAAWVRNRIEERVPVLMLGDPGFDWDDDFFRLLGLKPVAEAGMPPWSVAEKDDLVGFEAKPPRITEDETTGFLLLDEERNLSGNRLHLSVKDQAGKVHGVVVTGPWGGLALAPWILDSPMDKRSRWILDPFALIRTALHLPDLPMPDVTTLNGRRLWMNHIDGDGFPSLAELPGNPLAAEVIRDRILKRHPYPHTVSVIEGEIGPHGLYPRKSRKLEAVARSIFRLPNVEAASHSFSHPFSWIKVATAKDSTEGYNLPIPGYRYDPRREILGSVAYIDRLLPRGKHCRIFLWTGDCLPGERELRIVSQAGLMNMNGGDTTITRLNPSLSFVSPMARPVGSFLQIYAPTQNENVYTHNWTGPFYGFRRVIDTFELTDRPRRLKPIDIYYHFYSGTKAASLKALEKAYRWAESQETAPVFVSDYVPLVREFRRISIARRPDGTLQYRGIQKLRELRLLRGGIDLRGSRGVAGVRHLHDGLYIHLASDRPLLRLAKIASMPSMPRLRQANGFLDRWENEKEKGKIRIRLHARVPLLLEMAGVPHQCSLRLENGVKLTFPADVKKRVKFAFAKRKVIDGALECR